MNMDLRKRWGRLLESLGAWVHRVPPAGGTELSPNERCFKSSFTDLDAASVKGYGGNANKGTHRAESYIWLQILAQMERANRDARARQRERNLRRCESSRSLHGD